MCKCAITTSVILINILVHLCGAALLGLGVWAYVGDRSCLHRVVLDSISPAIVMGIVGGVVIMLTACLAIYASLNFSKRGIVCYSTFSMLVICVQVFGCILLFYYYRAQVDNLQEQYKDLCGDSEADDLKITNGLFSAIYYAVAGSTIFSIFCELLALVLIVYQYQDIE